MLDTPEYNPAIQVYVPGSPFTEVAIEQFKNSDGMIVSTPYLKEVYSEYNEHIYVVPNSIDTVLWGKARKESRPGIRIGWAGGASHEEDLRVIEPIFDKLLAKYKDLSFVFVHGVPPFLRDKKGIEHITKWARIDRYPQHIASLDWDIALAPLKDNAFNRGKSNLRWLESAALGIPCVASNVGHFKETIRHGEDGFLADSADDFVTHISTLIEDKKLRHQVGARAKARVDQDFNVDKTAAQYVSYLEEVIAKGGVKTPPSLLKGIEDDIKPMPMLAEGEEPKLEEVVT